MEIHQLSVNYLHEQDRILVRINTRSAEEVRLWLTRRLCLGWVPVLRSTVEGMARQAAPAGASDPATDARIAEFKKLQNLKDADFKTPFNNEAQAWPLGSEPLLVTSVRLTVHEASQLEVAFEESLIAHKAQMRAFQATLEQQLLHGFMHLLEQALESAQWEPAKQPRLTEFSASGPGTDLGDGFALATELPRPKYLH